MPIGSLTQSQSFALLQEATSARNLLAYGIRAIRTSKFLDTSGDAILTTLSIGCEKLLKISLGLRELEAASAWPSKSRMQAFNHGVVVMDRQLRDALRSALEGKPYPASLLAQVEADPVLPPLLAVLDRYGRSGRFYYLDELASEPQTGDSPNHMWNEVEWAVFNREPAIKRAYQAAKDSDDNAAFEASIPVLRGAVADTLVAWWETISVAGRFGAFGEGSPTMGWEVHPDSVPPEMNPRLR